MHFGGGHGFGHGSFSNGLAGERGGHLGGLHGRFVHGYGRGRAGFDDDASCYPYVGVWPYCQY
jgi:hypothetical protein